MQWHAVSCQGKTQTTRWTQCHQREGTSAQLQSHLQSRLPKDEGRSEAPGSWQSLQELEARDAHGRDTLHQGVEVGSTLSL